MIFLNFKKLFGVLFLALMLGSCAINSNMMFKIPKDGSFKYDSIPIRPVENYKISIDDKLTFNLSTNKGKNLIEGLTGTSVYGEVVNQNATGINNKYSITNTFLVKTDGFVEIPVLGNIYVKGLTVEQCEDTLENLFKYQYNEPFIQMKITNRRCIVFAGNGGDAKIIPLENSNTTLLEVIAMSGGISTRGKSRFVKVMRKVNEKREIYLIDISNIDGIKYADMIVQANDYIYIEPRAELVKGTLSEWAPISSLISSVLITYSIFQKYK